MIVRSRTATTEGDTDESGAADPDVGSYRAVSMVRRNGPPHSDHASAVAGCGA